MLRALVVGRGAVLIVNRFELLAELLFTLASSLNFGTTSSQLGLLLLGLNHSSLLLTLLLLLLELAQTDLLLQGLKTSISFRTFLGKFVFLDLGALPVMYC